MDQSALLEWSGFNSSVRSPLEQLKSLKTKQNANKNALPSPKNSQNYKTQKPPTNTPKQQQKNYNQNQF